MGKWRCFGYGASKDGLPGPMKRVCRYISDPTLRAVATRQESCKTFYPLLNRKDRRTLVKYRKMYLKGMLSHG